MAVTAPFPSVPAHAPLRTEPDLRGQTVVALHPHPDDEAIFTGITLRRLADAGARTVLVMATGGELGGSRIPLSDGETVRRRRLRELERSAELLGVSRLVLLNRRDSGLPGGPDNSHARALAGAEPLSLATRVAEVVDEEGAGTLLADDEQGVYGHPDHRMAGVVGTIAAELTGAQAYLATVDRTGLAEGGHLVHGAARAAAVEFGRASDEIALTVTGDARHLTVKRAAILAHASQVDPAALPEQDFAAAYGREWFRRTGGADAPGVLDLL
ncbi:PIG-L deacetylase family protein [Pseudonocardia sp. WMMC193]|uniref:PIG-L deacetylase family protein n=1 Tax=Pseudonocardia sp. WMMC193 TaxID=2911965 RepID=UPI001F468749|nr:PIG-L deacetylase family protein [Pseudonocardia sp. WMMC193]MCF7548933.1 PIG-L family deacetylase [Pseudonocardia sp. WMMC193]